MNCRTEARERGSLTVRAVQLFAAKAGAFVLAFALPLLLVRRMSMQEFGLYKQVFLVVGTALVVVPLGVGMSAFYYLPRESDPRRRAQIVLNVVLFMLTTSCVLLALLVGWPNLLPTVFNDPALVALSPLIGVTVVLWVLGAFLEFAAIANGEARFASVFIIASQITKTALLLGAAIGFGSVRSLVYAAIAFGTFQTLMLLGYLRSRFGAFWRSFSWAFAKAQLAYALPFGVAAVVLQIQLDIPHYFVSHEFGAAVYAVYAVGCFNIPLVAIIAESAGSVMIPRVSELQSQGRTREIAEATARMVRKLAAFNLPLFAFLLVFGQEFIETLFTERYLVSWPVFAINILLIPLGLMTSACDPVLRAYAEHRFFFLKLRVGLVVALVVALWLWTAPLGIVGTIAMVVVAGAVERVATAWKVARILGLSWRDATLFSDVARIGCAVAVAALTAATVRYGLRDAAPIVTLAVGAAVFGATYIAAMAVAGVAKPDDWAFLGARAARLRRILARPAAERSL